MRCLGRRASVTHRLLVKTRGGFENIFDCARQRARNTEEMSLIGYAV
jgi:hypothetical protein